MNHHAFVTLLHPSSAFVKLILPTRQQPPTCLAGRTARRTAHWVADAKGARTSRVTRCAWGVVGIIWRREVVFFEAPIIDLNGLIALATTRVPICPDPHANSLEGSIQR